MFSLHVTCPESLGLIAGKLFLGEDSVGGVVEGEESPR